MIVALAAQDLQAQSRLLGSKQPRPQLETIMILAATGQRIKKIRT